MGTKTVARALAAIGCAALIGVGGSAQAARASGAASTLVSAATSGVTNSSGVGEEAAVVAYRTASGAHLEISLCDTSLACQHFTVDNASLSFSLPHTTVAISASIAGLGPVSLTMTSNSGNSRAYECVGNTGTFHIQGLDVEGSVVAGAIGDFQVTRPGCGAWGTQSTVEYALL